MPKTKAGLYPKEHIRRCSGGNPTVPSDAPGRSAFDKDYGRLLHAPAFRRLQGKTQLFPGKESDFFRNRLTHSLEVAQIASGLANAVNALHKSEIGGNIDLSLVQFASLAHDLGHPPFGHNGEHTLDEKMLEHGGFEGNAQTLRILCRLERRTVAGGNGPTDKYGLDLTYRTLAAVLKYDKAIPTERKPGSKLAKGFYQSETDIVEKVKESLAPGVVFGAGVADKFKTIECSIMDLADDISYSTYDLDDSLRAGFCSPLSLLSQLCQNADMRLAIIAKTNESLRDSGYRAIDEQGLYLAASKLFLTKDGPDLFNGHKVPRSVVDMGRRVAVYANDHDLRSDKLARARYTGERVGRLIGSVELDPRRQKNFPNHPWLWGVRLSRQALIDVELLKHLIFQTVTKSPRLRVAEHRGKKIVEELFDALTSDDGSILPEDWAHQLALADGKAAKHRVVCDYIAGMTDRYAVQMHEALFGDGVSIYQPR